LDGILNVNKPAGWTSFDVVAVIRRGAGERRVGHAGTLDPMATGVLPVCLGRATRLVEYLVDATKVYTARVRLGIETDTYDADGRVVREADASGITAAAVESALAGFRGRISQTPPPYSAIKKDGVPLYKLARAGRAVEPHAREVVVHRLELTAFEPPFLTLVVECGKGTYIRSLAHDLGKQLGCGASLTALARDRVGPFDLASAVDIETLRDGFASGEWQRHLIAPDEILLDWPAAIFDTANASKLANGGSVSLTRSGEPAQRCRAYTTAGDFLAVLERDEGTVWRPAKVFPADG
jgi:tRNA pseudouridine55 synthase